LVAPFAPEPATRISRSNPADAGFGLYLQDIAVARNPPGRVSVWSPRPGKLR